MFFKVSVTFEKVPAYVHAFVRASFSWVFMHDVYIYNLQCIIVYYLRLKSSWHEYCVDEWWVSDKPFIGRSFVRIVASISLLILYSWIFEGSKPIVLEVIWFCNCWWLKEYHYPDQKLFLVETEDWHHLKVADNKLVKWITVYLLPIIVVLQTILCMVIFPDSWTVKLTMWMT